jgi:hypothetical protein
MAYLSGWHNCPWVINSMATPVHSLESPPNWDGYYGGAVHDNHKVAMILRMCSSKWSHWNAIILM